jgi:RNA polymerase sigma-70 factor (ECF subfamily)
LASTQPQETPCPPPPARLPTFEELFDRHAADVLRWAARLGGSRVEPDDVAQEVFAIASRRLPEFRGDAKPGTWLFRITERVVRNHRRKRRLRCWLGLDDQPLRATGPTPAEALDQAEAARALEEILGGMPEKFRTVLVLFEIEGLATAEIAELVGVKVGTVRVWLHRARARFLELQRRRDEGGSR